MTIPSILACFGHPDDEGLSSGALAASAAAGAQVTLVCATRGEVGEIADPALATPETLGQVREGELRCAAQQLGIHEVIFLDYHDSGMAGTEQNHDPRAFVRAPAEEVVAKLVAIIRRLRPAVVITFDPGGAYGHPDHISIYEHTVSAFHRSADEHYRADLGAAWQPERLLFTGTLGLRFKRMRDQLAALGEDVSGFDQFASRISPLPELPVHVTLTLSDDIIARKRASWACHKTQLNPNSPMSKLPEQVRQDFDRTESFTLAWPEPADGLMLTGLLEPLA